MRRVFEGGVGVESGGRDERSMDIGLRDSLETGREDGGDASVEETILIVLVLSGGQL